MHAPIPLAALRKQATALCRKLEMNTDEAVYRSFDRDPRAPLLFGGSLHSQLAFFGRDPGRDEIRLWEPLVGSAGKRVRAEVSKHRPGVDPSKSALYFNTVPYKQVGNKAWGRRIIRSFHPLIAELLVSHWEGTHLVTLGNEAFRWFIDDAQDEPEDRYERHFDISVCSPLSGNRKRVRVYPLPHPSPLNQTWYKRFPDLLHRRLDTIFSS